MMIWSSAFKWLRLTFHSQRLCGEGTDGLSQAAGWLNDDDDDDGYGDDGDDIANCDIHNQRPRDVDALFQSALMMLIVH